MDRANATRVGLQLIAVALVGGCGGSTPDDSAFASAEADTAQDAGALDAAAGLDGGEQQDAATAGDTGSAQDTGRSHDTGTSTDTVTSSDAGTSSDAATPPDAGGADAATSCATDADCAALVAASGGCAKASCAAGWCHVAQEPDFAACDDDSACTELDSCVVGMCAGKAVVCDDGNPCTADSCPGGADGCIYTKLSAKPCSDGDACTSGDICDTGACKGKAVGALCDDGNPCTQDLCDAKTGCKHPAADGQACDDGSVCNSVGTCQAGKCKAGKPRLYETSVPTGGSAFSTWDMALRSDGYVVQVGVVGSKRRVRLVDGGLKEIWHVDVGSADVDFGMLAVRADGSSVVVGERWKKGAPDNRDGWIVRVSAAGKAVWEKSYNSGGGDTLRGVAPRTKGYWACGSRPVTGASSRGWLIGVDESGAKTLDKTYGSGSVEGCQAVVVAPSNGALVAGYFAGAGAAYRVDDAGKVLWHHAYKQFIPRQAWATSGGYALVGEQKTPAGPEMGHWLHVSEAAKGGVLMDVKINLGWQTKVNDAARTADGGWAFVGYVYKDKNYVAEGLVGRIDSHGILQWTRLRSGGTEEEYTDVVGLEGGDLLISGGEPDGDAWKALVQARTDAFGNFSCTESGQCAKLGKTACADGKVCTRDACSAKTGCSNPPFIGSVVCGANKTCQAGACK